MPDLRHIIIDRDATADHATLRSLYREKVARGLLTWEEAKKAHGVLARWHQNKGIEGSLTPDEPGRIKK